MPSNVHDIIASGDLGGGLIPTEYSNQIIQDAPKSSVSLTRMRQIRMSTRTRIQPVLDSKPLAYWVGGDTGLKQTTKMKWSGLTITAEEMAAIVPIPEAVIADSGIPAAYLLLPAGAALGGVKRAQPWPRCISTDRPRRARSRRRAWPTRPIRTSIRASPRPSRRSPRWTTSPTGGACGPSTSPPGRPHHDARRDRDRHLPHRHRQAGRRQHVLLQYSFGRWVGSDMMGMQA